MTRPTQVNCRKHRQRNGAKDADIVRSAHELLQTEFGLEDGLVSTATWANVAAFMERRRVLAQQEVGRAVPSAPPSSLRTPHSEFRIPDGVSPSDPFVQILDVATDTATFLMECIEVIERTMKTRWARELGKRDPESPRAWPEPEILARWRDYVPNHLLPRLYGFEIMMAPYAIAHLKLALKLGESGYQFRDGDRLHIYLTNTFEPPSEIADAKLADLLGPLAREAQEVNQVKRNKRFTVVIGNPPYSSLSANLTPTARALVEKYKFIDGERVVERNALQLERNLNDGRPDAQPNQRRLSLRGRGQHRPRGLDALNQPLGAAQRWHESSLAVQHGRNTHVYGYCCRSVRFVLFRQSL